MNTPRTKKPKRYEFKGTLTTGVGGTYGSGISNTEIASLLGQIASGWPHVEESMVRILLELLGGQPNLPVRQIFRSIINEQARIKILRVLLEETVLNKDKDQIYDEILDEFQALNKLRNKYLHGQWWTHQSGRVFFSEMSIDDFSFFQQREIKSDELLEVGKRMGNLIRKIYVRGVKHAPPSSPPTPPEQPDEKTPPAPPAPHTNEK